MIYINFHTVILSLVFLSATANYIPRSASSNNLLKNDLDNKLALQASNYLASDIHLNDHHKLKLIQKKKPVARKGTRPNPKFGKPTDRKPRRRPGPKRRKPCPLGSILCPPGIRPPRPGVRPGPKPGIKPRPKPGVRPGPKPGIKPGVKPGVRIGPKPGVKPRPKLSPLTTVAPNDKEDYPSEEEDIPSEEDDYLSEEDEDDS